MLVRDEAFPPLSRLYGRGLCRCLKQDSLATRKDYGVIPSQEDSS